MWRIKCSNGLYVNKTTYGTWISYSNKGKIFTNEKIALKNLSLCQEFANKDEKHNTLTYTIEQTSPNN
jgi:hypothetical protein